MTSRRKPRQARNLARPSPQHPSRNTSRRRPHQVPKPHQTPNPQHPPRDRSPSVVRGLAWPWPTDDALEAWCLGPAHRQHPSGQLPNATSGPKPRPTPADSTVVGWPATERHTRSTASPDLSPQHPSRNQPPGVVRGLAWPWPTNAALEARLPGPGPQTTPTWPERRRMARPCQLPSWGALFGGMPLPSRRWGIVPDSMTDSAVVVSPSVVAMIVTSSPLAMSGPSWVSSSIV